MAIFALALAGSLLIWANFREWSAIRSGTDKASERFWQSNAFLKSSAIAIGIIGAVFEYRTQLADMENTINTMTGGDSFVHAAPVLVNNSRDLGFEVTHIGEYPVYDIRLRIYRADSNWNTNPNGEFLRTFDFSDPAMPPGSMPTQMRGGDHLYKPSTTEYSSRILRYIAVISSRNGYFVQLIRLELLGSEWDTNLLILERGDPNAAIYKTGNPHVFSLEKDSWEPEISELTRPRFPDAKSATLRRRRDN